MNKSLCSQNPERMEILSTLVSLLTHTSIPNCTTAERPALWTLQGYRMNFWFSTLSVCVWVCVWWGGSFSFCFFFWKMRHWRESQGHQCDIHHARPVRRENSVFCRCKLPFVCQGPHSKKKKISFTIASGIRCNDKWALQRAPLMNQWEAFSHGPSPSWTLDSCILSVDCSMN